MVAQTEFALKIGDDTHVDVERMHVRWQTKHFFIESGRVHTAFGYWNNAYHHGRWLQPTIERPRWVAFEDEGGLLPVHWVGLDMGFRNLRSYPCATRYHTSGTAQRHHQRMDWERVHRVSEHALGAHLRGVLGASSCRRAGLDDLRGFAVIGYTLGIITPYAELERFVSKGGSDPFFVPDPSTNTASFDTLEGIDGIRIDLTN